MTVKIKPLALLWMDYKWLRRSGLYPWCAVRYLIQHRSRIFNR